MRDFASPRGRCYEANGKCGCIKRQSVCLCGEEGNMFKFDKTGNSIMCCMGKGVCCCQNFDQTCYLEGLITPEPENYCCKIRTGNVSRCTTPSSLTSQRIQPLTGQADVRYTIGHLA
jgi:hypothetical protein